jgi:hypothetical protein
MKKGCFISVMVFLTIALIAVFYLVKHHGEDLLELGKNQLVELAQEQIFTDIGKLENNQYSDSLKVVVENYFKNIDKFEINEELTRIEEFSDDIEVVLMDSRIDSAEFDFITNILIKYERRKEN